MTTVRHHATSVQFPRGTKVIRYFGRCKDLLRAGPYATEWEAWQSLLSKKDGTTNNVVGAEDALITGLFDLGKNE